MPLIRSDHEVDVEFTQIRNHWVRDSRLSLKAIGLLAQIMSHKPGWSMSIDSLAAANSVGRDQIRSAIKELEDVGYLEREQSRTEESKFSETIWRTRDPWENPLTENPMTENPTAKNTITKNTNLKNKERIYPHFDEFWQVYPKKVDKGDARRAWITAIKKADPEYIVGKATEYANDPNLPERRYIKDPASWLNAEAWENGPLPKRGANEEKWKKEIEDWLND